MSIDDRHGNDAANSPTTAISQTRWDLIILSTAGGIICAMQIGKVPPVMAALSEDFGIGKVEIGWVVSLLSLLSALFGVGAGALADRAGYRLVMTASLVFVAFGNFLGAISQYYYVLLLSRVFEGVALVGILVALPSVVARVSRPEEQRFALGIISPFFPTGVALMLVASPWMLNAYGWRSVWILNAVISGIFALIFYLRSRDIDTLVRRQRTTKSSGFIRGVLEVLKSGPLTLALGCVVYCLLWYSLSIWFPPLLMETQGFGVETAATLTALLVLVTIIGSASAAFLMRAGAPRWKILACSASAMALFAFGIYMETFGSFRVWMAFAYAVASGMWMPTMYASVPRHAPSPQAIGAVNGMLTQANGIGYLITPPIFAAAVTLGGGWHAAAWYALGAGLMGIVTAVILKTLERASGADVS